MDDITEKLCFKSRVIFFSPLCKQLVKSELESMIPQLAQLLSLLLLLAFQPLRSTNTFDAVLVLERSYLVLFTPCRSPASSRAHTVHPQLFNGLNFDARYSALFHTSLYGGDFCWSVLSTKQPYNKTLCEVWSARLWGKYDFSNVWAAGGKPVNNSLIL